MHSQNGVLRTRWTGCFRHSLNEGLVVGAVFGLVEILFVFVTGEALPLDAVPIAVANLLLWTFAALNVEAIRKLLGKSGAVPVPGGDAVLVTICLLFLARRGGFGGGAAAGLLESVAPVLLVLLLRWGLRERIQGFSGLAGLALVGISLGHGLLLFRVLPKMGGVGLAVSAPLIIAGLVGMAFSARIRLGAMRVAALVLLAALAAATGLGRTPAPPVDRERKNTSASAAPGARNLVLIVMDTARRDHLGLYGYLKPTSPRLEELAHESLVFEHAYAASPYSLSSHASLLSGVLPSAHGARPILPSKEARERGFAGMTQLPIDDRQPMFAEKLRNAGYRTGLVSANFHFVTEWSGMDRGFDYFDSRAPRVYRFHPWLLTLSMRLPSRFGSGSWFGTVKTASQITDSALDWLSRPGREPFFLFLNYFDAHDPYHPPSPYDLGFSATQTWTNYARYGGKAARTLSPAGLDFVRAQYDAGLAGIDHEIGRLWDALKQSRRDQNTVFIVTSDHGEFFGEHGRFKHFSTLYEEVVSVPLLARIPQLSVAARPTYRVGIHQIPDLALAWMQGGQTPEAAAARVALAEPAVLSEFWSPTSQAGPPAVRAIYWGRFKLIQASDGHDELYDLAADPREVNNLLGAPGEAMKEVRLRMIAGLADLEVTPAPRRVKALDPETEDRLRALGYIR